MHSVNSRISGDLQAAGDAVAQKAKSEDDGTRQEVRFAVAMSGGVSLAVWMGGVAREMNLLQQASNLRESSGEPPDSGWDDKCRKLYLRLLDLLDVTVTTDVLSGTSAGGINAALLGLASVTGVDLGGLRDLWLRTGSMDLLLRDPGEQNPTSLMQGDKVLFNQLNSGIWDFYLKADKDKHKDKAGQDHVSTTVFITTTMMSGETSRFTDDYGTLVPDVDHHGLFTFDERTLGAGGETPALTALALAARSSASFPGAFEPAYVPIHAKIDPSPGVPEHPDMAAFANMTRGHWVADGGLLANRPLTPLLAKVFSQPATGQVRRVLAFVVPDGGGTTNTTPDPVPDDDWKHPPTMVGALKADLNAQLSQSIASDLEATRLHNERINTRHDLRRYLADLGSRLSADGQRPAAQEPPCDGLITGRMLRDFQRQQGAGLAQPLLAEMMRQLTTMRIPAAWAKQLAPGEQGQSGPAEPRMAEAMVRILGGGWHEPQPAQQPPADEETAAWAAWTAAAGDPCERAAKFGLPVFHAARAVAVQLIRLGYQCATVGSNRSMLAGYRKTIEDASRELPQGWTGESEMVRGELGQAASANQDARRDLMGVAADLANRKRRDLLIGEGAAVLKDAWEKLAAAVQSLLDDLRSMAEPDGRVSRAEAARAIGIYRRYFGDAPEAPQVADRLLRLVLAERSLLPVEAELDQPVEFVQFSANTRTLLAPGEGTVPALDSVNKLRGVELHHFAAFYKSSWRAWDWMWGRLDGSGWLVHILLDPRRILAVVEDQPDAYPEGGRAAAFAAKLREIAGLSEGLPGDCLAKDLAFLDQHTADIPVSLPNSALFLAQAWQNLIAANELPVIADRMVADSGRLPPLVDPHPPQNPGMPASAGQKQSTWTNAADSARRAWHGAAARHRLNQSLSTPPDPWVTSMRDLSQQHATPEDFARQLLGCPVRQETLAGELRTPAFARLAAKAAAVTTSAVAVAPEAPGTVRPVLTSARTITRTGYVATKVTGGVGWKTLLAGVLLTVVGVLLATQGMIVVGLTGTIIALAGLYLIALGAWGIHRGVLGALTAITALAIPALLTLNWVRTKLWGTKEDISSGLVPAHVLPWLRDSWWAGLAVLGGIILLAVLFSLIPRRRPRPNSAAQRPTVPKAVAVAERPPTDIGFPKSTAPAATALARPDAVLTADPGGPSTGT
jgi:patatin-related protein